jgi:hypothetical protein
MPLFGIQSTPDEDEDEDEDEEEDDETGKPKPKGLQRNASELVTVMSE